MQERQVSEENGEDSRHFGAGRQSSVEEREDNRHLGTKKKDAWALGRQPSKEKECIGVGTTIVKIECNSVRDNNRKKEDVMTHRIK